MNPAETFHHRFAASYRLFLIALVALAACGTPATPTRIRYPTPSVSPTPSFMEGTKDLSCDEALDLITPENSNTSVSVFPGGHSQWWVGRYKNGRPFLFASGYNPVNKNTIEFAYRCSPFEQAQELYQELLGK